MENPAMGARKRIYLTRMIEETNERPDPKLDDERRRYYGLTDFGRRVSPPWSQPGLAA